MYYHCQRIIHFVLITINSLALPVGEYTAVALLTFFGLSSIRNAWEIPSSTNSKENTELGELVEAEELVKEKVT